MLVHSSHRKGRSSQPAENKTRLDGGPIKGDSENRRSTEVTGGPSFFKGREKKRYGYCSIRGVGREGRLGVPGEPSSK